MAAGCYNNTLLEKCIVSNGAHLKQYTFPPASWEHSGRNLGKRSSEIFRKTFSLKVFRNLADPELSEDLISMFLPECCRILVARCSGRRFSKASSEIFRKTFFQGFFRNVPSWLAGGKVYCFIEGLFET
jgi:hypothetical protein